MGNALTFLELLAVSLWLGGLVHGLFTRKPGARWQWAAVACSLTLAAVQTARGLLWTWDGITRPALMLFSTLAVLSALSRRASASAMILLPLIGYLYWMSMRGY
ncbi:MAG: hypothetical protein QM757_03465 [Paludibaculum sp.]